MPFLDNGGVDPDVRRGPLWGAFATLFEHIERMIALNIAWTAQFLPLLLVAIYPGWPLLIRIALILYSAVALAVGLGVLYGLVRAAVVEELLTLDLLRDTWRTLALPGLVTLAPLYGIFGVLLGLSASGLFLLEVLARLLILLCFVCSMYWGALLAESPQRSAITILRQSALLVWRKPGRALLVSGTTAVALLIGTLSIGGLFLIVPVLVALLQTHMFQSIQLVGANSSIAR
jgi:hypothetical protein